MIRLVVADEGIPSSFIRTNQSYVLRVLQSAFSRSFELLPALRAVAGAFGGGAGG
jgi:hypothetical protein